MRLILLLIILCAGCTPPPEQSSVPVKKGEFVKYIPFVGELKSKQEELISAPISAQITWLIPEGTIVKKGDIITKLSHSDEDTLLREAELNLLIEKQQLEYTQIRNEFENLKYENREKFMRLSLESERIKLAQTESAVDAAQLKETELSLQNQHEKIENLKKTIANSEKFAERGFIASSKVEQNKTALEKAKLELDIIENRLAIIKEGSKLIDIEEQRNAFFNAQKDYEIFVNNKSVYQKNREYDAERSETEIEDLTKKQQYYREIIEKAMVRSPVDGIVIHGKTWVTNSSEEKVSVGSNVWEGWDFLKVSSLEDMQISITVTEYDLAQLNNGMDLIFALDSAPENFFHAKIIKIQKFAEFDEQDENSVKFFDIKAQVIDNSESFKPGMTVSGKIILKRVADCMMVDNNAISGDCVTLLSGKKAKITISDSNYFESVVTKGLNPGDLIVIKRPSYDIPPEERTVETAEKRNIRTIIEDIGILEAQKRQFAISKISGKINSLAEEGTEIKKGDVICTIDAAELQQKLEAAELKLKVARTNLELLDENKKNDIYKLEQELKLEELDLELARLDYETKSSPPTAKKLKDYELSHKISSLSLERIKKELEIKKELNKKGYVSDSEINELTDRYNSDYISFAVSEIKFELEKMGSSFRTRERSRIAFERAKLAVELQKKIIENKIRDFDSKKQIELLRIQSQENDIQQMRQEVADAEIKAEINGVASYIKRWTREGEKKITEGEQIHPGMSVLEISDISAFIIKGKIAEEEFSSLKTGLPVEFSISTYPDELYEGTLKSVALFAEEDWSGGENSSKIFEVEIIPKFHSPKFQPNMSVQFTVVLNESQNTVVIPRDALFVENNSYFVLRPDGSRQNVQVGIKNNQYAEILSGISEGENILGHRKEIEISMGKEKK